MYPPVDGELAFKLAPGASVEGAPPGGGSPPSAPPMDGGKPIGSTGTLPGPERGAKSVGLIFVWICIGETWGVFTLGDTRK